MKTKSDMEPGHAPGRPIIVSRSRTSDNGLVQILGPTLAKGIRRLLRAGRLPSGSDPQNSPAGRLRGLGMSATRRPRRKMEIVPVDWETHRAMACVSMLMAAAA